MPATDSPPAPLTFYGLAHRVAAGLHPSLDADLAEASASAHRRMRALLGAGRDCSWNLFEPPLPGEYRAPSVACLAALLGVATCASFRALSAAVQRDRIAQAVALFRGWGLPDEVIRLRLDFTGGAFPDAPPPARLDALRDGCLVEAAEILREARAGSPVLPSGAEVVGMYLAAW